MVTEEAVIRRMEIRHLLCLKTKKGEHQEVEIGGDGDDVLAHCSTQQHFVRRIAATGDAQADSSLMQMEWREQHCLSPPFAAASHSHGRSREQKTSPCVARRGNDCGRQYVTTLFPPRPGYPLTHPQIGLSLHEAYHGSAGNARKKTFLAKLPGYPALRI